MREFNFVCVG